ncbi:MAG: ABC-type uncharacterized transport system substrate-binding protein [Gammaproteobacteria bacterium]|jgi:ABC-type uncharacterized transport system substrate-binding protein
MSLERRMVNLMLCRMLICATVAGVLWSPIAAVAHPHILASVSLELTRDSEENFVSLKNAWLYDPGYTAFAMRDIDRDGDRNASEEELLEFSAQQIEALGKFNYFTKIMIDDVEVPFSNPTDYALTKSPDGGLTLSFELSLDAYSGNGRVATIEVFDPNFFAYFTFPKDGAAMSVSGGSAGCDTATTGPEAIDLKLTRDIPKAFWAALDGSVTDGHLFLNEAVVSCQ